jgi:hypothetical protein
MLGPTYLLAGAGVVPPVAGFVALASPVLEVALVLLWAWRFTGLFELAWPVAGAVVELFGVAGAAGEGAVELCAIKPAAVSIEIKIRVFIFLSPSVLVG